MTKRETVPFSGILKSELHEAACRGTADKTTLYGGGGFALHIGFSRIRIKEVDIAIPDGIYMLVGLPTPRRMRLSNGIWTEEA
jgi:hypothetical protein